MSKPVLVLLILATVAVVVVLVVSGQVSLLGRDPIDAVRQGPMTPPKPIRLEEADTGAPPLVEPEDTIHESMETEPIVTVDPTPVPPTAPAPPPAPEHTLPPPEQVPPPVDPKTVRIGSTELKDRKGRELFEALAKETGHDLRVSSGAEEVMEEIEVSMSIDDLAVSTLLDLLTQPYELAWSTEGNELWIRLADER